VRRPCRGKSDLDERPVALTTAKNDLIETVPTLKRWLEVCADDVSEEPEDLKNVGLTRAIGADKYVEIAQR
jgi:hypothetical protein